MKKADVDKGRKKNERGKKKKQKSGKVCLRTGANPTKR